MCFKEVCVCHPGGGGRRIADIPWGRGESKKGQNWMTSHIGCIRIAFREFEFIRMLGAKIKQTITKTFIEAFGLVIRVSVSDFR